MASDFVCTSAISQEGRTWSLLATRSDLMMAGIRGSNTSPEMKVRRLLHRHGFRFRLHKRDLPGRPDVELARYKVRSDDGWHPRQQYVPGDESPEVAASAWLQISFAQARSPRKAGRGACSLQG